MRCYKCGYTFRQFENTCPRCLQFPGSGPNKWTCPTCSAENSSDARACWQCGTMRQRPRSVVKAKLGTFQQRLVANVIDITICTVAVSLLYLVLIVVFPEWAAEGKTTSGLNVNQVMFIVAVTTFLAYNIAMLARWGYTIGKRAFRLRVVRPDGTAPGPWRILFRTLAWMATLVTLGLLFFLLLRDPMNRGLHDKLADTLVVRE